MRSRYIMVNTCMLQIAGVLVMSDAKMLLFPEYLCCLIMWITMTVTHIYAKHCARVVICEMGECT